MPRLNRDGSTVGLPIRPFLYTLDQVADLLSMSVVTLKRDYLFFDGLSTGAKTQRKLMARNIAPVRADKPEWRVSETELVRWLRHMGFRVYDRAYVQK